MRVENTDLVIRIDRDRKRILFLERARHRKSEDGDGAAIVAEIDITYLESCSADAAEAHIGFTLLKHLDNRNPNVVAIREYNKVAEEIHEELMDHLQTLADKNDPAAQYDLATTLLSEAIKNPSWDYIKKIEELIQKSSAAGFADAGRFMSEEWPKLRIILEKKLSK